MNGEMRYVTVFEAETGVGAVIADDAAIIEVILPFGHDRSGLVRRLEAQFPQARENELTVRCADLLVRYFGGEEVVFDLPLDLPAQSFRRRVYEIVRDIPYGSVMTYGEIAAAAGSPHAARAVGGAMAANLLPVLVPCHRVVGAGGKLVGFSAEGGVASKNWLLRLERVFVENSHFP